LRPRSSRRCSCHWLIPKKTSTRLWRRSLASSATDVWSVIAEEAGRESPLWASAARADPERQAVFSPLCHDAYAVGLETIYEGYLCHYGRPRLFAPEDDELALLLGDYLYAHGLVRIAATGSVGAVAELAELISICARLRAEGENGDGQAWLAAAVALGPRPPDDDAVERALAAHRACVAR
jgi:hypothetical protein